MRLNLVLPESKPETDEVVNLSFRYRDNKTIVVEANNGDGNEWDLLTFKVGDGKLYVETHEGIEDALIDTDEDGCVVVTRDCD